MSIRPTLPRQDLETLATWGTENLTHVIAIESQSNEHSDTIPSSEGQRVLSSALRSYFEGLGYACEQDNFANLLVTIPSNLGDDARDTRPACPAVAFMVHMDTAEGTQAVPALVVTPTWDGGRVVYPDNDRLTVTATNYPELKSFVGQDLLHGHGRYPIGLDDKLGMAELMTLARVLKDNPKLPHGEVLLVFRPDEEIGRMGAVEALAGELARRGVRYGYTVDGILPYEINVENFNAAGAKVTIHGEPLVLAPRRAYRRVDIEVTGVNTHGATAKAEGHLNSTVLVARAVDALGARQDIVPVAFASDPLLECNAQVSFLLCGDSDADLDRAEEALLGALGDQAMPHAWKGAGISVTARESSASIPVQGTVQDGAARVIHHLRRFLKTPGESPLLPEDSDNYQGYTNPFFVAHTPEDHAYVIEYRLRDFDPEALRRREEHLRAVCAQDGVAVVIRPQYINMGPELGAYPELGTWAEEALRAMGRDPVRRPIRGGTGVDPFLAKSIPVANLGTGYFAPESEKELTSRQMLAGHVQWLASLVQVIAAARKTAASAGPGEGAGASGRRAMSLEELEALFAPQGKTFRFRMGPRFRVERPKRPPVNKKLCFVATDKAFLVELLYELSEMDEAFFVKYSLAPTDGMYLGRCFVTDEKLLGILWARYKPHPKLMCSVQDDDWAEEFRPK